jgi:tetratricopeptide (TPR) repeat protein
MTLNGRKSRVIVAGITRCWLHRLLLGAATSSLAFLTGCASLAPSPAETNAATENPYLPQQLGEESVTAPVAEPAPPEIRYGNFTEDQLARAIVAELALQRGQFSQALTDYAALARETNNISMLQRVARVAALTRQPALAIEMAELWLLQEPESVEARQTIAMELVSQSRFRDAFDQFEILLRKGNRVDFRLLSARVAAASNNGGFVLLDGLIGDFDTLLREFPQQDSLRLGLAHLYQVNKQPEPALEQLQQLQRELSRRESLPAEPGQEFIKPPDLAVLEIQLLDQLQQADKSRRRLEQGVKQYPEHKELRYLWGRRLIAERDYGAAKAQFALLVEQNPKDYELLYSLALLSLEVNLFADARNYLQLLVANGQRLDDAQYFLGFIETQENRPAAAIDHYLLVRAGSNFLQAQRNLADLMIAGGRYEELRAHLQNLRFRNPELNIPLLSLEANALISSQRYDQARTVLNNSIGAFPNNVELLFLRSVLAQEVNDLALMESDLRKIISLEPQSPVAYNSLGYTLADRTERYEEALQLIERAIALAPDDPAIIDSLGWVQYKLGRYQEAKVNLTRAYELYPDAEVAAHLGEVLWMLGERSAASRLWRDALANQPDSTHLRSTMQRLAPANTL